jgi:hypothetical protein
MLSRVRRCIGSIPSILEEIVSAFEEDARAEWAWQFRERYLMPTG